MRHCERCHTFTETEVCAICRDPSRDARQLCVVETPADQAALERTGSYRGLYFVLMGRLSPLDGVGVNDIGARQLLERAGDGVVEEVIIATNFTAEGEATAHVAGRGAARRAASEVTRLARGVPVGSELEYVDLGTIAHALRRSALSAAGRAQLPASARSRLPCAPRLRDFAALRSPSLRSAWRCLRGARAVLAWPRRRPCRVPLPWRAFAAA